MMKHSDMQRGIEPVYHPQHLHDVDDPCFGFDVSS
jgi:hypothetical protein